MTHFNLEIGHPAHRERLSPKIVERLMATTVVTVEAAWIGLLGYGVWRLIFG
jgi:hypothetical protein